MSIRPEYASAIFNGEKRFEFRRNIFREPIRTVVIYVTTPVRLVQGEFDVLQIIEDDVASLWNSTQKAAGIDHHTFMQYFRGCDRGFAIQIGTVRKYRVPFNIDERFGMRPPQSFAYLPADC